MKRYYKIWFLVGFIFLIGYIVFIPLRKWARAHVNYKTAVDDHPLLCTNCHLYTQKSGLLYEMVNANYLSPFNIAVSQDGTKLYVVAEEGNALLVVDIVN